MAAGIPPEKSAEKMYPITLQTKDFVIPLSVNEIVMQKLLSDVDGSYKETLVAQILNVHKEAAHKNLGMHPLAEGHKENTEEEICVKQIEGESVVGSVSTSTGKQIEGESVVGSVSTSTGRDEADNLSDEDLSSKMETCSPFKQIPRHEGKVDTPAQNFQKNLDDSYEKDSNSDQALKSYNIRSELQPQSCKKHLLKSIVKKIPCSHNDIVSVGEVVDSAIEYEFESPQLAKKAVEALNLWFYDDCILTAELSNIKPVKVKLSNIPIDVVEAHLHKSVLKRLSCDQTDIIGWSDLQGNCIEYEFANPQLANKAVKSLNLWCYDDSVLEASLVEKEMSCKMKVSNLPDDVVEACEKCSGLVKHLRKSIIKKIACSESDLICWGEVVNNSIECEFATPHLAENAANALNFWMYDDCLLQAVLSDDVQPERRVVCNKRPFTQDSNSNINYEIVKSPSRKQSKSAAGWIDSKVDLFIDVLIEKKKAKAISSWTDDDWVQNSEQCGMPVSACKYKKKKLYDQHSAIIRSGRPTSWGHMNKVHILKYGALDKGPQLPAIEEAQPSVQKYCMDGPTPPGKKWGDAERDILLDVWNNVRAELRDKTVFVSSSKLWTAVSAAMKDMELVLSPTQCETQINKMLDKYKKIYDSTSPTAMEARNWTFFNKIHSIMGKAK